MASTNNGFSGAFPAMVDFPLPFDPDQQQQREQQQQQEQQRQQEQQQQREQQEQSEHQDQMQSSDNANANGNTNGNTNESMTSTASTSGTTTDSTTGTGTDTTTSSTTDTGTSTDTGSTTDTTTSTESVVDNVLNSVSDNQNDNGNTNDSDTSVDVGVDFELDSLPDDADLVDIDLSGGAQMGDVYAAGGDLDYDPGHDIDISDFFDGALDGRGNDVGQSFIGSNNLMDNDSIENVQLSNNNAFTATANGGTATADEGISLDIDAGAESDASADAAAKGEAGVFVEGDGEEGMMPPLVAVREDGPGPHPHHDGDEGGAAGDLAGDVGGGIDGGMDVSGSGEGYADLGDWGSGNGRDGMIEGTSLADADANLDISAFNQNFVLGANVLGNSVDTTVVGGDMAMDYAMDDSVS